MPDIVYQEYKGGNIPPQLMYFDDVAYYIAYKKEQDDGTILAIFQKWCPF